MARKSPFAIIFIDEIDAIGGKRCDDSTSVGKEYTLTLDALLTNMGNLPPNVRVIAATNHINSLDPALIRSGRFGKHVYVPLPDEETRKKILDYYMEGASTTEDLDLQKIAKDTEGFSGADLNI
ncbi:MAG: ATP-dependent zinc metalloprotease FtsH [Wolbachia endosymbiont of Ctenocephalides orientis wCori]|nr:MAG: ATP-dependent zinc metalloprotease FtsH [Wolbachia endosymbiont of Ctenocephalides orientis wCori]